MCGGRALLQRAQSLPSEAGVGKWNRWAGTGDVSSLSLVGCCNDVPIDLD